MTDQQREPQPLQPAAPGAFPPESPGTPSPAPTPTAGQPAGWRGKLVVLLVLVVPLAIIIWAVKDNVSADDLKVGDCFNVPTTTTVSTIQHFPCTESHTAEVIHVTTFTDDGSSYPISFRFDSFAETACTPVFQTYVGAALDARPDLSIGYFFPSRDGWAKGDRAITCYATRTDDAPMTTSVKGSGSP